MTEAPTAGSMEAFLHSEMDLFLGWFHLAAFLSSFHFSIFTTGVFFRVLEESNVHWVYFISLIRKYGVPIKTGLFFKDFY